MRLFVTVLFAVVSVASAQQHNLDPAYLRQYYSQLSHQEQRSATPIHENQEQQQYVQQSAPQKNYPRPQQQAAPAYYQQEQARQYQQQPQQVQYQQPKAQPKRPAFQQQAEEENPEDYDPNPSYQFGFDVKDEEFTNYQNRKEQREGNVIKGSYSVVDSDGFIRTVTYTADPKEGFKAEVVREPTDIVIKVPTPAPATQQHQQPQQFRQAAPAQKQAPQQYQYAQPSQQQQQQQQYRQPQQARPDYSQYQQ